jgi:hypothetical protein
MADEKRWTCKEFEEALPELFERAEGGKLSADPRFAEILRDCPQAAELVRDLEYIAVAAAQLLVPDGEAPSSDLWAKIQGKLGSEPSENDGEAVQ